jgi:quercetin dioxygenase-like cupin family protein
MMNRYKVSFSPIEWESPLEGVRQKAHISFGKQLRLVEYEKSMPVHWCNKGHFGIILEGRLEIEFDEETHLFEEGDGVCIPSGDAHRHRATVLSDVVKVLFVEEV